MHSHKYKLPSYFTHTHTRTHPQDRSDISQQIQSYLHGISDHPLVVYGPTGYGKTVLMALAAYHLRENNPGVKIAIVVRFIGLTPHSSSIFHTLRSISEQVYKEFSQNF